jgi:hypothetical protein
VHRGGSATLLLRVQAVALLNLQVCGFVIRTLNLKRNADVKAAGANHGGYAMLAEIFMLRLEAAARAAKEAANSSRFVPITLPTAKAS